MKKKIVTECKQAQRDCRLQAVACKDMADRMEREAAARQGAFELCREHEQYCRKWVRLCMDVHRKCNDALGAQVKAVETVQTTMETTIESALRPYRVAIMTQSVALLILTLMQILGG